MRRQLRQWHGQLPRPARGLLDTLGRAFPGPTALRFLLVLGAAVLTVGNHTILHALRTLGPLVSGAPSSYHRVFSHRRWSRWRLAKRLAGWVLDHRLHGHGPMV